MTSNFSKGVSSLAQGWNFYLIMCCLTVCLASFQFGFNIGSTNLPTPLIKDFYARRYFAEVVLKDAEFDRLINKDKYKDEANDELRDKIVKIQELVHKLKSHKETKVIDNTQTNTNDVESESPTETRRKRHSEGNDQPEATNSTSDSIQSVIDFANFMILYDVSSKSAPSVRKAQLEKLNAVHEIIDQFANQSQKNASLVSEIRAIIATSRKAETNEMEHANTLLWTITTTLFVVGGTIGAFTSKNVAEQYGRKNGILFHYSFTVIGALLVFIAPYIESPECVMASRFFYGLQGGMTCGLVPTYLTEISPINLRGQIGVLHQLCLTLGILIAQTLGFRQLLGVASTWHLLLALPIVPCVIGGLGLMLFFPESPRALLINAHNRERASQALIKLRRTRNIDEEIEQIIQESNETSSDENMSLGEVCTRAELRWPLLTGIALQLAQQLCGINAVFFYSVSIFEKVGIQKDEIQYAVFATGLIIVICTIVCVPLIDKLGRKPLLVYPMLVIIVDFLLLTAILVLELDGMFYSYLSIVCIIIFIICFAVGLGPIPFIYVAECFKQDSRSAALAICMFTNWVANLVLTLTFPYMTVYISKYYFLVFTVIVAITLAIIIKKVPETKGRNIEEIMREFNGDSSVDYKIKSDNFLMNNTNAL